MTQLREKEIELVKCRANYEKKLNEVTQNNMKIEGELVQMKRESSMIESRLKAETDNKIAENNEINERKIKQLQEELDIIKEKNTMNKNKKKALRVEMEKMKIEKERINNAIFNTVRNHEKDKEMQKEKFQSEIDLLKAREEEYMRTNLNILESDIYKVYNENKEKFEEKLKECMRYKSLNEKMNDENKLIKVSLDTNDNIFKEISKMQYGQTKLLKQFKENFEQANREIKQVTFYSLIYKLKEEHKKQLNELNEKTNMDLQERDQEIKSNLTALT